MAKFQVGDVVYHNRSGGTYEILHGPEHVVLEAGLDPAYIYQAKPLGAMRRIWVRSATEMEDGRFRLISHG